MRLLEGDIGLEFGERAGDLVAETLSPELVGAEAVAPEHLNAESAQSTSGAGAHVEVVIGAVAESRQVLDIDNLCSLNLTRRRRPRG